jgi:hypothetical protein
VGVKIDVEQFGWRLTKSRSNFEGSAACCHMRVDREGLNRLSTYMCRYSQVGLQQLDANDLDSVHHISILRCGFTGKISMADSLFAAIKRSSFS